MLSGAFFIIQSPPRAVVQRGGCVWLAAEKQTVDPRLYPWVCPGCRATGCNYVPALATPNFLKFLGLLRGSCAQHRSHRSGYIIRRQSPFPLYVQSSAASNEIATTDHAMLDATSATRHGRTSSTPPRTHSANSFCTRSLSCFCDAPIS